MDAPPGPPPAPVPPAQVLADAALSPLRAFVNRFRDRERIRRVAEAATVIGAVLYAYGWYMLTVTFGRFDLSAEDVGFGFSALLVRVVPVLLLPAVVAGIVMKLVHMADTPLGRLVENLGPNGRTAFAMGPLVGLLFALPALLGFGLLQSVFDASTGSAVVRRIVVCVAMTAALALLFDLLVCLADSDWSWNGVVTQLFRAASLTAPLGALALARTLPLWARVIVGVAAVAELAFASPLSVRRWLTMPQLLSLGILVMLAAYALAPVALMVPSGVLFGCGLTVALDRGSPPADSTSGGQDGTGSPAGIAKDLDATRTTPGQLVQATERVVRAAGAAFVSVLMVAVVLAAPVVLARSTEDRIRDGKTVALPGFLPLLRIQRVTVLAPVGLPVTGTCVLLLGRSDGETIIFEPNRSDRHEGRVYRLPSDTTVLTGC